MRIVREQALFFGLPASSDAQLLTTLCLEVLACIFVSQWQYKDRSLFYYDWLVRDFFKFMLDYIGGWIVVPGTGERIYIGDTWVTKCESAYRRAAKAEEYEHFNSGDAAADEWRKIFGQQFAPLSMSLSTLMRALAATR